MNNEVENLMEFMKIIQEGQSNKNEDMNNKLIEIFKNQKILISHTLKVLSLKSFNNKDISLELYLYILIYLKNSLNSFKNYLIPDDYFSYIKQICEIIFNYNKNNQILNDSKIFDEIENIMKILLTYSEKIFNKNYINDVFKILLDNIDSVEKNIFLQFSKYAVNISYLIIKTKTIENEIYEEFYNKYYNPVMKKIFKTTTDFFIDEKNNNI